MTDEEAAETEGELMFNDKVTGGRIPKNFIPAVEKGFRNMFAKGPLAGFPVVGIKFDLKDGSYHDVDSSDMAFMVCAENCFREAFPKMKPVLLEPIMLMEIECPRTSKVRWSAIFPRRRGIVMSTDMVGNLDEDHRRGATSRDVRLLDRPAFDDARAGHVHDGVHQVPAGADEYSDGNHRRAEG